MRVFPYQKINILDGQKRVYIVRARYMMRLPAGGKSPQTRSPTMTTKTTRSRITCWACGQREWAPGEFRRMGEPGNRLAQCGSCGGLTVVHDAAYAATK